MDIVNPPDIKCVEANKAHVSLRSCICGYRAVKVVVKIVGVCKSQYQGRGPENCKNTKFVTHTDGEWIFLIVLACKFSNFYLFMFNRFRGLNPILLNMHLRAGN